MLDLVGGSGSKPKSEERPRVQPFVIDPTPEEIAAMDDDALLHVYRAVAEYDASGGRVRRKLRRELDRRRRGQA